MVFSIADNVVNMPLNSIYMSGNGHNDNNISYANILWQLNRSFAYISTRTESQQKIEFDSYVQKVSAESLVLSGNGDEVLTFKY